LLGNLNQPVTHNLAFSAGKLARGQHNGAAMFEFLEFFARVGMTRAGLGPACDSCLPNDFDPKEVGQLRAELG
jgi:hypothetical protein